MHDFESEHMRLISLELYRKVGRPRMDDHSASSDDELIHHNSNSIGKKKAARQANNYEFSEGEDVV